MIGFAPVCYMIARNTYRIIISDIIIYKIFLNIPHHFQCKINREYASILCLIFFKISACTVPRTVSNVCFLISSNSTDERAFPFSFFFFNLLIYCSIKEKKARIIGEPGPLIVILTLVFDRINQNLDTMFFHII